MAELVDAQDLKSCVLQRACGFESRPRHIVAGGFVDEGVRRSFNPVSDDEAGFSTLRWDDDEI